MARIRPRELTVLEAAARIGVAEVTLRKWRKRGYGPLWYRRGPGRGIIFYLSNEVDAWVTLVRATSGPGSARPSVPRERG